MTKIKKILGRENVKEILLILICAIFVCLPLLSKNLDITYDDGIQHIARLMGTYQSIKENQTFSVIMSNFCNEFGYSWNIFYSPITAYLPLIFKLFNFSFIGCIKMFMFIAVFLSGITMYFFTKEVSKNKNIALLSSIFYIFAPYRFTDMYLRNALAELTSFIFIPMVFHGLYGILKEKPKKEYILIFGSIGLILTHTVIAMYTAILCFIYLLTQIKKLKNKEITKKIVVSLLFIIVITSFFYIPLLEHKISADYEVFKEGRMERQDVLVALKLKLHELILTPTSNIRIYEIGIISIVALLFTPLLIKKMKVKYKNTDFYKFYKFSIITSIILLIMTLNIFPFEKLPSILKMLQFTFRLLEFTSFFLSFVVAVNLVKLIKKFSSKDIIVITILLMILSSLFTSHLHFKDNIDENRLWPAVRVTSKTGRVHAGCASFEYLPSKAFNNRSYIETRENRIYILEGNANIEDEIKQNTNLSCKVSYVLEETKLELPYIYYLGYQVTLEKDGKIEKLKTYETENGFVGVTVPILEEGNLKVSYEGTILMKISTIISILGTVFLILYFIKNNIVKTKFLTKNNNISNIKT